MNSLTLIVNADDYGATMNVNRGIERAYREGIVTSTSLMVNQSATEGVHGLRRRCPTLGIGIHLTLTLGFPISPPENVRTLLDQDGRLLTRQRLLDRVSRELVDPDEVAAECVAQTEVVRRLGVEPDHWNVHQHLQEYAVLGTPIAAAMSRAGVYRARNPERIILGGRRFSPFALYRTSRRARSVRIVSASHHVPDGLLDAPPHEWHRYADRLPNGIIEAICHPCDPDGDPHLSEASARYQATELAALTAPELRNQLERRRARLASFEAAFPTENP